MTAPPPIPDSVPPAGWYGDPAHPARQRWWDGQTWSNQVRGPQPPQDAPPVSPAPPMTPTASRWGQPSRPLGQYVVAPTGAARVVGPTTADDVALASFGRRFLATILDTLLVSFAASAVLPFFIDDFQNRVLAGMRDWYAQLVTGEGTMGADLTHLILITTYAQMAATMVYGLVTLSLWSRTLGQRVTGIAVCPADKGTEKISWREAIPRTLLWTLLSQGPGFLLLIQMVSVSLVLWHPRRQTLPDLLARTQVVRR